MGLIKEPKSVNFYVIDKPWSQAEKKEFSELIMKIKSKNRKTGVIKKSKVKAA